MSEYGFAVYAVCSESEAETKKLKERLGLHFTLVSDPQNLIAKEAQQDYLPLAITMSTDKGAMSKFLKDPEWYPHGAMQPGLLFLDLQADGQHKVLYKWACKLSPKNFFGALDRPNPDLMWDVVKARIEGRTVSDDVPLVSLKETLNKKLGKL